MSSSQNENPKFDDVLSIQSNPEDLFTLLFPIGKGGYGKVYKAIHKSTLKLYAIKIIDYTKGGLQNKKTICYNYNLIQEETSLMRLLQNNDYLLKYYGSYYSRQSNTIWLILEYCSCGNLVDLMYALDRRFEENEIATFLEMILKGLIYLHDLNIIHRDIKCQNIFVKEDGCIKLGDFGSGAKLTDEESYRRSKAGSAYWMSPQVILQQNYDTKTDIWSLGITSVELAESEPPFLDLKQIAVMNKIAKSPPTVEEVINVEEYSESFVDFIRQCLIVDPNKRPTAKELIEHEFIKKNSKGKDFVKKLIDNNMDEIKKQIDEKINNIKEIPDNIYNNKDSDSDLLKISNEKINEEDLQKNNNNQEKEEIISVFNENENEKDKDDNEELYSYRNNISSNNEEKNNDANNNKEIENNENQENQEDNSVIVNKDDKNEGIMEIISKTDKILNEIEDVENVDDKNNLDIKNEEKEEQEENEEKEEEIDDKQKKLIELENILKEKIKRKKEKKEKEKSEKKISQLNEDNIKFNVKTPTKKEKKNLIIEKDDYNNNHSLNFTSKASNEIKALLLNEKNKNINNEEKNMYINIKFPYSIQKKRSDLTTGITGSKTDSSDGKKFMLSKINLENYTYTKKKINFNNNANDLSNVDIDSDDERINPIRNIFNVNFTDNKLEKSYSEMKYIRTAEKQNKFNILKQKNIDRYLNDFNINTTDDNNIIKNIHFSAYKEKHKKYFN